MPRHVGELESDDGVVDEFGAEGTALVGVFYAFLVADAGEANALDNYADTLVVEVGHYDWVMLMKGNIRYDRCGMIFTFEPLVLLADQVLYRDFDVLKGDVGCAG